MLVGNGRGETGQAALFETTCISLLIPASAARRGLPSCCCPSEQKVHEVKDEDANILIASVFTQCWSQDELQSLTSR
jgi:hypothetical protein